MCIAGSEVRFVKASLGFSSSSRKSKVSLGSKFLPELGLDKLTTTGLAFMGKCCAPVQKDFFGLEF